MLIVFLVNPFFSIRISSLITVKIVIAKLPAILFQNSQFLIVNSPDFPQGKKPFQFLQFWVNSSSINTKLQGSSIVVEVIRTVFFLSRYFTQK